MNEFVGYLNSMNNAKSESMNALAESQIMQEYYSEIEVERDISKAITKYLKDVDNHEAIILTGHAGDGKTSILIQVLKEFGYFDNGPKPLEVTEVYKNLYYIKDMSELSIDEQKALLMKFLECKNEGKSAIIVSNTGPIITAFKDLFGTEIDRVDMEKKILKSIDNIISEKIIISTKKNEYSFRMVNIANIDNSYMAEQILTKILNEKLWEACFKCESCCKCPIFENYKMVSSSLNDIINRIGKIYFWLSEKGSRLTIRQMMAHITFSLTSNLDCERVHNFSDNEYNLNKYSFANSFFGEYRDPSLQASASNIKTIKELKSLGLDKISFGKFDDDLFIKENFNIFPGVIRTRVKSAIKTSGVGISDNKPEAAELRQEIRRYFIIFAKEESNINIDNIIMGEPFAEYYRAISGSEDIVKPIMRRLNKIFFIALYRYFIGVYPMNDEEYLYITLRKDFHFVQNTQMLIARVPKDEIKIIFKEIKNKLEPTKVNYKMILRIGEKGSFDVSSEFMEYMFKFYEGEVFTNLQPSFSYGISKLKTQIMQEYKVDDDKLTLIIIQNDMVNKMSIQITGDEIIVE